MSSIKRTMSIASGRSSWRRANASIRLVSAAPRSAPWIAASSSRNDGDRDVVDGAVFIALQLIDIGQRHGRYEDDGNLLESRVVADHGGQLEPVQIRHDNVDQDDRDLVAEELFQCGARRFRLYQVFPEIAKNNLVAQKL